MSEKSISELIAENPEQFCGWQAGIKFVASHSVGHWVSGVYRGERGMCYCQVFDMGDTVKPSLWTRIQMRLQGWTWVDK